MIDGAAIHGRGDRLPVVLRERPQQLAASHRRQRQRADLNQPEERIGHLLLQRRAHLQEFVGELIDLLVRAGQVAAFRAGIIHFEGEIAGHLALDAEVPLLRIAGRVVRQRRRESLTQEKLLEIRAVTGGRDDSGGERIAQAIERCQRAVRGSDEGGSVCVDGVIVGADVEGDVVRKPEDPISASQHRLVVDAERQAEAGSGKVVEIHVVAACPIGRVHQSELAFEGQPRGGGDRIVGVGNQNHHAVEAFGPRPHLLETEPVIQGEPRGDLKLISPIVGSVKLLAGHEGVRGEAAAAAESQQERCEAVAAGWRERTGRRHVRVEVERPGRIVLLVVVVSEAAKLRADLERVPPGDLGDVGRDRIAVVTVHDGAASAAGSEHAVVSGHDRNRLYAESDGVVQ